MNEPNTLGCEYCSGEDDKKGWIGNYSSDGYIGYSQCWNCNKSGKPSPDEPSSAVQPPNTDTLDEQIRTLFVMYGYPKITIAENKLVPELVAQFIEHAKQARIDQIRTDMKWVAMNFGVDIDVDKVIDDRIAQLSKRNK